MFLYIIIGFIIPWILGVYLFIKMPKLIIIFVPIGIAIAFLINTVGFNYFWRLKHSYNELSLSALPFDLGIYPILTCLFIISIYYKKLKVYLAIIIFTVSTTLFELLGHVKHQVIYRNGWNIYWTSVSYFVAYLLIYFYYKLVNKYEVLNRR
ncbi:hypothetical protein V7148_22055 [Gottfriedia acidiceleris]|uniref:hypothetical protein n=1 Tax=Bacillaceae TaxID=186817 RepID=UPI000BF7D7EA|nr:hypothetical protein [Bacillus sp. AFS077874]PFM77785.1 hypothetical protein COJ46_18055 [Bacillus sp. AFS077874]